MAGDYPSALWPEGMHLKLMRAALSDGPAAVGAFEEWADRIVFDDIDPSSFRMMPLLRWNLGRMNVKHPLVSRLDSVSRFLLVETTMKLDALRRLARALQEIDVPRLLLKGTALGQRYYPHQSLRPMADCDLLIPHGMHEAALKHLFASGWQSTEGDNTMRHYSVDLWHAPFKTIQVELHWRSSIESTFREDRDCWRRAQPLMFGEVPCLIFSPEDEIIHACRHGFNWTPQVPPMRWLADCAMVIRHAGDRIDWDTLAERARDMEETLCVRRSLEWLRRENVAPVPVAALRKLTHRNVKRRERRIYVLKAKPKDWPTTARMYAEFLNRETPWWQWPLHPRRVLRYFAGQFALPDHSDIFRYFVYQFHRQSQHLENPLLKNLLVRVAKISGMSTIAFTWLDDDFIGRVDEPFLLNWARRKMKLDGFSFGKRGEFTGPLRVLYKGEVIPSMRHEQMRPDIANRFSSVPVALKSGFSVEFEPPTGKGRFMVERKLDNGKWKPLFEVRVGDFKVLAGNILPATYPVLTRTMEFGGSDIEKYLVSGWSASEGNFRWSSENRALLIFAIDKPADMLMEIKMRPFITPKNPHGQDVLVFLNHLKVAAWKMSNEGIFTAKLAREFLTSNNILAFEIPQAISPSSIGLSKDFRKLGIYVEWMKFHPLERNGMRGGGKNQSLDFPAGLPNKELSPELSKSSTMGAIHFSIDTGMVEVLQAGLPLETMVETGTFEGGSVVKARPFFQKIVTIEMEPGLHRSAREKFKDDAAVEVLMGDSPAVLGNLKPRLENASVLYWLDAHWCVAGHSTAGKKSQCPLLGELDAIGELNDRSVILIDDARLFLAPPPAPHEADDWPDFDVIVSKLRELSPVHVLSVVNDVIAFVPNTAFAALREYARLHSPDLLVLIHKAGQYDAMKNDRDRLARDTETLAGQLRESEEDRAARLDIIHRQEAMLKDLRSRFEICEADRAARLEVIERQQAIILELEARLKSLTESGLQSE